MEENQQQEEQAYEPQQTNDLQPNEPVQEGHQAAMNEAAKLMEQYNPFEQKEEQSEIEINVSDPLQKSDTFSKYTVYNVKGQDEHGPFEVFRRFNDFFELRQVLIQRWPGCFIPAIPAKKTVGNTEANVVDDRKKHLNYFCIQVSKRRHLYYSQEFQEFLRSKEADIGKSFEKMSKLKPKDIIERYKEQFSQLNGKEITQNLMVEIANFMGYLKKSRTQLQKFKEIAKSISQVKKQYSSSVSILTDVLMPDYEKHCISQYAQGDEGSLIFNNEQNQVKLQDSRTQMRGQAQINSFEFIAEMVQFDYRDCDAMIEAIEQKDFYEKSKSKLQIRIKEQNEDLLQLSQGKKSIKYFFKGGDNQQQKSKLEHEINCNQAEAENTATLIDLITGILGFIEIEKFKEEKTRTYHKVLQNAAYLEITTSNQQIEFWKQLGQLSEEQLSKSKDE